MYVFGGNTGQGSLSSCECYDPRLDKWSALSPMKRKRAGAGVTVINSHIYVVGKWEWWCGQIPMAIRAKIGAKMAIFWSIKSQLAMGLN